MSKTVMVVDDEPDILITIGQMLKINGYSVISACDGKECLKKLNESNKNPDLIVLDIMMPEISGWDVAAKIKENPDWKDIPIVFLTAKGDTMSIGMGEMASEDYIIKPFDINNLRNRIQKILEK
jgi:DNA-binding response OmpR family regulator